MATSIYITHEVVEMSDLSAMATLPDWRATAITRLQQHGMRVVNPIDWAISSAKEQEGVKKQVQRALDLIDLSDFILANLHRSSYGTAMEIFYAHQRGKVVAVVGQSPFSPWVVSHSQARFGDLDHALEYLIGESINPDLLGWALQFENHLSERYEQFPPSGEPDYQFFGGELPVMVMAPHATNYFREGILQDVDTYSGALVATISRLSRAHGLLSNHCLAADPCLHLQAPFVRAIADIAKSGKVGLAVMVMGMAWHESQAFVLESSGLSAEAAARLRLKLSGLDQTLLRDEYDEDVKTLCRFMTETLGVPVIVLRVHRRFRVPRLQLEPFAALASAVGEFVRETGTELLRSAS